MKQSGYLISIHAPRVGSDLFQPLHFAPAHDFNPRSPCGERLRCLQEGAVSNPFQSTLPVWGATIDLIEAQAAEIEFQSTLPVWGATRRIAQGQRQRVISIHAPRVGSDCIRECDGCLRKISIHAPRVGSDCNSPVCSP